MSKHFNLRYDNSTQSLILTEYSCKNEGYCYGNDLEFLHSISMPSERTLPTIWKKQLMKQAKESKKFSQGVLSFIWGHSDLIWD